MRSPEERMSAEDIWLQDEHSKQKPFRAAAAAAIKTINMKSSPPKRKPRIALSVFLTTSALLLTLARADPLSMSSGRPPNQQQSAAATSNRQPHFVVEPAESSGSSSSSSGNEVLQHQRVSVGRTAKFKCVVEDIGLHKVIWFHKEKRLPLVIDNQVNIWKDRLHASSQGNSVFFLQLDNVQVSDKGHFSCQLNTQPLMSQVHVLEVVKPPQIREEETTINVEPVKEFAPLELRCAADGIPKPTIKWRRESQMHVMPPINYQDDQEDAEGDEQLSASSNELDRQQPSTTESSSAGRSRRLDSELELERTGDTSGSAEGRQAAPPQANEAPNNAIDAAQPATTTTTAAGDASDVEPLGKRRKVNTSEVAAAAAAVQQVTAQQQTANRSLFMAEGEVLRFDRISRYDMGFYMCIASNGVPPSVSQRIFVPVSFVHATAKPSGQRALTPSARRSDAAAAASAATDQNDSQSAAATSTPGGGGGKATRSRISPTARRGGLGGGATGRRRINQQANNQHLNSSSSSSGDGTTASSSATSNLLLT